MTAPPSTRMTAPSRILVVDDNAALRENVAECLEIEGFQVAVAEDGHRALAALKEGPPPRVVLVDLMMPGMDGRQFVSALRADPELREVRVVLTTGMAGARTRNTGADAVLPKPFGVRELLQVIRDVAP